MQADVTQTETAGTTEAVRRVATLVAEGVSATELFAAVSEEIVQVAGVNAIAVERYEPDRTTTVVAGLNAPGFRVGSRWELDGPSVASLVLDTGRPARIDDYSDLPGKIAAAGRASGITSAAGVPIVVDGAVWGMIWAGTTEPERLPDRVEAQLSEFAELVAIAVSNAESRDRLRRLADQQAALRRVATLAAEGASSAEVFSAVAQEAARTLDVLSASVVR